MRTLDLDVEFNCHNQFTKTITLLVWQVVFITSNKFVKFDEN